jgi:hypothetical protein
MKTFLRATLALGDISRSEDARKAWRIVRGLVRSQDHGAPNQTWREHIAVARQRKQGLRGWFRYGFTAEVEFRAWNVMTCAAAEVLRARGLDCSMFNLGSDLDGRVLFQIFPRAVADDQIDEAERILDLMEERADHIKREAQP